MAHRRLIFAALLATTIAAGLISRTVHTGVLFLDKSLGDALYAVAVYFALRLIWPGKSPIVAAVAALTFCLAIECFKFTGLPAAWRASAISRVIFGTTPSWHNLVCYGLGIGLVAAGEVVLTRRCK